MHEFLLHNSKTGIYIKCIIVRNDQIFNSYTVQLPQLQVNDKYKGNK